MRLKERVRRPRSWRCPAAAQCQETLRTARHPGADRAIHVETDAGVAAAGGGQAAGRAGGERDPGLVILGKQAIDDDNQTGQMLAALTDLPQATFASKVGSRTGRPRSRARSTAGWRRCR